MIYYYYRRFLDNEITKNHKREEQIWEELNKNYIQSKKLKYNPSYSKYILAITYMYMSQMINYDEEGVIFNENITT